MDLFIYGQIGREVKASEVVQAIAQTKEPINVYINSQGGNVYEGMAIYNALERHGDIATHIDGIAYSAASWPVLAAPREKRFMAKNAQFGIHNAINFGGGNKEELKAQIEVLDRIDKAQIEIYEHKTDLAASEIVEIMKRGTPLSFEEALSLGFVSGEHQPQEIAAIFTNFIKTDMGFKIEDLISFKKQATNEEPVKEEIKAEVEDKVEAEHKKAETPAEALSANFTQKSDFEAYKAITEPFMNAIIEYIQDQPKKEEIEKMIDKAANAKLVELLSNINSQGSVPAPEETQFAEAKQQETFEPLTLGKGSFWKIKEELKNGN